MAIDAGDQFRDFSHRGDVGGDVEGIGDQQQQHDALQHDRRERRLDVGGKSFPVTRPMRAHMDWIAAIRGKASGIVHSMLRPN